MSELCVKDRSIRLIPEDILKNVFNFLDANTLLQIELACVSWRLICQQHDEALWLHLCDKLWSKYTYNRPAEMNILTRIKEMSLANLKKALRNTDLTRCIEKKDFQRMLMAKIVLYKPAEKELSGNDPRFKGRYLSMYYPEWALTMGVCKMSYFYNRKELQRRDISEYELCNILWSLSFKNHQNQNTHHRSEDYNGEQDNHVEELVPDSHLRRFYPDGTVDSHEPDVLFRWRFEEGRDGKRRIQVEHFPPISSYRLNDGRWCLENLNAKLRQVDNLSADQIPLTTPT